MESATIGSALRQARAMTATTGAPNPALAAFASVNPWVLGAVVYVLLIAVIHYLGLSPKPGQSPEVEVKCPENNNCPPKSPSSKGE